MGFKFPAGADGMNFTAHIESMAMMLVIRQGAEERLTAKNACAERLYHNRIKIGPDEHITTKTITA